MNLNSDLREMILGKRLATPCGTILFGTVGIAIILPSDHKLLSVQSIRHWFYKWKIQSNEYTPSPPRSRDVRLWLRLMIAVNFPALFFLTRVKYKARFYFALTVILMTNFLAWAWFDFHHHFFKYARATQGWVLRLVWM